ncbi:MAG: biotin-dependent carboxyltransferase [Gammaproteobacteria bacterium]|nr:MAG: biotin-dependent carboxyltransferase [Gammaproteobacteria bacterium]
MTLIQDGGRTGYHRLGLTTGGPADALAFAWANRLCGNQPEASSLEITVGGLELDVDVATRIAVCGADMPLSINGDVVENWRSHRLYPGDRVTLGFARSGVRAYLAVAGGLVVSPVLGSSATVIREGIGGIEGRKLKTGDNLVCPQADDKDCLRVPTGYRPVYNKRVLLRMVMGYQHDAFAPEQRERFYAGEYQVSSQCDRMGYRLEGPTIHCDMPGMLSEGISLGAVQVPPDGQPIVLLCDRQTIGGYPKLGAVLSVDLPLLAQLPAGGRVSFAPISVDEAREIRLQATKQFEQLAAEVCPSKESSAG